jgi:protein-S-isoprenylcysteine O-methyltransferase Ste14
MIDESLIRAALLLGPCGLLAVLWVVLRPGPRAMTGAALALLWNIPFVLLVNVLAFRLGWWSFAPGERSLLGMPVDVLLGWSVFWGPVAALAPRPLNFLIVLLGFAWIDVLLMPQLKPLVTLGDRWLFGEAVALMLCLLPGQILVRDTQARESVGRRAALQGIGYGAWLIFLIPAALCQHAGIDYVGAVRELRVTSWIICPLAFVLLIGLAALHEFAAVGGGTPIPLDPPQRLVTTGPYAYLANPMQVVSIAVMLLLACWLGVWELVAMAASFLIYSVGFVRWHHGADIANRFGPEWTAYRAAVPNWWPRWRPYEREPAKRHVAERCRIAALARALEHTNLALACLGWFMRLPGLVWPCVLHDGQKRITLDG